MRKTSFAPAIAVAAVLAAGGAEASQCSGISPRVYADPVVVHEAEDGAKTLLIRSTGTTIQMSPGAGETRWQHCVGLWRLEADKTGSGSGNCYSIDADGDQWTISWEGASGSGTWEHVSGTGKYADMTANGTWESGARFADDTRLTLWEGVCGE